MSDQESIFTITKEEFLDSWPEHEKGWTHRAMEKYIELYANRESKQEREG